MSTTSNISSATTTTSSQKCSFSIKPYTIEKKIGKLLAKIVKKNPEIIERIPDKYWFREQYVNSKCNMDEFCKTVSEYSDTYEILVMLGNLYIDYVLSCYAYVGFHSFLDFYEFNPAIFSLYKRNISTIRTNLAKNRNDVKVKLFWKYDKELTYTQIKNIENSQAIRFYVRQFDMCLTELPQMVYFRAAMAVRGYNPREANFKRLFDTYSFISTSTSTFSQNFYKNACLLNHNYYYSRVYYCVDENSCNNILPKLKNTLNVCPIELYLSVYENSNNYELIKTIFDNVYNSVIQIQYETTLWVELFDIDFPRIMCWFNENYSKLKNKISIGVVIPELFYIQLNDAVEKNNNYSKLWMTFNGSGLKSNLSKCNSKNFDAILCSIKDEYLNNNNPNDKTFCQFFLVQDVYNFLTHHLIPKGLLVRNKALQGSYYYDQNVYCQDYCFFDGFLNLDKFLIYNESKGSLDFDFSELYRAAKITAFHLLRNIEFSNYPKYLFKELQEISKRKKTIRIIPRNFLDVLYLLKLDPNHESSKVLLYKILNIISFSVLSMSLSNETVRNVPGFNNRTDMVDINNIMVSSGLFEFDVQNQNERHFARSKMFDTEIKSECFAWNNIRPLLKENGPLFGSTVFWQHEYAFSIGNVIKFLLDKEHELMGGYEVLKVLGFYDTSIDKLSSGNGYSKLHKSILIEICEVCKKKSKICQELLVYLKFSSQTYNQTINLFLDLFKTF